MDLVRVAGQSEQPFPCHDIPDVDHVVDGCGGEAAPVRAEGNPARPTRLAGDGPQFLAGRGVPDLDGAILAGSRQAGAIGAHRQRRHGPRVSGERQAGPRRQNRPMQGVVGFGHPRPVHRVGDRHRAQRQQQAALGIDLQVADGRRRQFAGRSRARVRLGHQCIGLGTRGTLAGLVTEEQRHGGQDHRQRGRTGQEAGAPAQLCR
jgi:hypothetical protein